MHGDVTRALKDGTYRIKLRNKQLDLIFYVRSGAFSCVTAVHIPRCKCSFTFPSESASLSRVRPRDSGNPSALLSGASNAAYAISYRLSSQYLRNAVTFLATIFLSAQRCTSSLLLSDFPYVIFISLLLRVTRVKLEKRTYRNSLSCAKCMCRVHHGFFFNAEPKSRRIGFPGDGNIISSPVRILAL